ncbi:MAG: hypothetical protein J0M04_20210 [Verrucomicrobia bacterium]|nr:hypothetical protein [Verrucomicrobiota bacterium]
MASSRTENALIMIVGVPVLGVLMGGIYSLPAMKITDERDPWLTILLGCGLAITVFGVGFFTGTPMAWSSALFGLGLLLVLGARMLYGSLGHNIERFGMVHMLVLMLALVLASVAIAKREKPNKAALSTPAPLRVQSVMAVQPSTHSRSLAPRQV